MWDQLGNEPSPDISDAKSEIRMEFKLGRGKKYRISDKSFHSIIEDIFKQSEVKKMLQASLSAWYNYSRNEIIKKCHKKFSCLEHNMKIFIIRLRFIGKIKILWINTLEKLYSPDSIFVKECCKKYDNILKGHKVLPPLPPSQKVQNII